MDNRLEPMEEYRLSLSQTPYSTNAERFQRDVKYGIYSKTDLQILDLLRQYPVMLVNSINAEYPKGEKLSRAISAMDKLAETGEVQKLVVKDNLSKTVAIFIRLNPELAQALGSIPQPKATMTDTLRLTATSQVALELRRERGMEDWPQIKYEDGLYYAVVRLYPYMLYVAALSVGKENEFAYLELLSDKCINSPLQRHIVFVCTSFDTMYYHANYIFKKAGLHTLSNVYFTFDRAYEVGYSQHMYQAEVDPNNPDGIVLTQYSI